jgi:formylglycine-generating enzyme required for sulfatase activity
MTNYYGAPVDGSAWKDAGAGDLGRRVIRGGCWRYGLECLRSSFRDWNLASNRDFTIGFRLARDLD